MSSAVAEMGVRLATIDMGRKAALGCYVPFRGELGPHLTQCGLGRGLATCIPSGILMNPTIWPQYTNVTDRQDIQDDRQITRSDRIGRKNRFSVWRSYRKKGSGIFLTHSGLWPVFCATVCVKVSLTNRPSCLTSAKNQDHRYRQC